MNSSTTIAKWIRRTGYFFGGLVLLFAVAFVAGYLTNRGAYRVAETVATAANLPFIQIDGYRFHGETFGDKKNPVVIVLHGGPGGDYRSIRHLKALSDRYFVVFFDQRGSGLSPRVKEEFITIKQFIADLHAIVKKFGRGKKVNLIGHSWGGMLSVAYIGAHPTMVNSAVLAEPGFLTTSLAKQYLERTNRMIPSELSVKTLFAIGNIWFKSLHIDGPDDQAREDFFMRRMVNLDIPNHPIAGYFCEKDMKNAALSDWRFSSLVSQTFISSIQNENGEVDFDLTQGLDEFTNNVLFVVGSCNTLIGKDVQQEHVKFFKRGRIEIIKDAGHTMFGEKPDESLQLIRDFLATNVVQPRELAKPLRRSNER